MRRLSVTDLPTGYSSVFATVAPEHHVDTGGMAVVAAGGGSHDGARHVHGTPEIFLVLEGHGAVEVGRVLVPEPAGGAVRDGDLFDVPATHRRVWDFSRDGVRRSVEDSLRRLGLDRKPVHRVPARGAAAVGTGDQHRGRDRAPVGVGAIWCSR